jgi:hypothetical protein
VRLGLRQINLPTVNSVRHAYGTRLFENWTFAENLRSRRVAVYWLMTC